MKREPRCSGFRDKNGRLIYEGDLLRTFHFKPANRRLPYQYLYHLVVQNPLRGGDFLEAVPVQQYALGGDGGCFWIRKDEKEAEIIDGPCLRDEDGSLVMWCERPRS